MSVSAQYLTISRRSAPPIGRSTRLQRFGRKEAKQKQEALDLAKLMAGTTITIAQKAGENDQLFGAVTAQDIAYALAAQNYTIDHRKVQLRRPAIR
jgi:large subunit ribosomal protein L9